MPTSVPSRTRSVVLVHWKAEELPSRVRWLEAAGYQAQALSEVTPAALHALKRHPPAAVVIDLSRLPSHGQRVGEVVQAKSGLTNVPLVFVDGAEATVARLQSALPRAVFTTWRRIAAALGKKGKTKAARKPEAVAKPAGYSATPLPKKLGVTPGAVVAVLGGPGARDPIWKLFPDDVTLRRDLRKPPDVLLAFATRASDYTRLLPKIRSVLANGGIAWAAWPKKTAGVTTDLTESVIRDGALASRLVDIKVCAIDRTWSGLRLARRRP